METVRKIIRATALAALCFVVAVCGIVAVVTHPLTGAFTDVYRSGALEKALAVRRVYDADGREIFAVNGYGRFVSGTGGLPEHTLNAFIAAEDARFYSHKGYDVRRIAAAAVKDILTASASEGASTVTQQLAKNLWLEPDKTLSRKVKELALARRMERDLDKRTILGLYLDNIYYGRGAYGISAAARRYFGTDASELDIGQSAMLAGIINDPSSYDPITHNAAAERRKRLVLSRMVKCGYITEEMRVEAEAETSISAPDVARGIFAYYALGESDGDAYTAYDPCVQDVLERAMTAAVPSDKVTVSAIVLDVASEKLVAAAANTYADISSTRRQAGSVVKPLLCYAPALESGLITPVTPLLDKPTDHGGYHPHNYGGIYRGWVTATESLCLSLNEPAVKLLDMVGTERAKSYAREFGLELSDDDDGLALALGSSLRGEKLMSLARAYCRIARGGGGAVGKETAYLITEMLKECAERGTAKALAGIPNVAAKTGTVGSAAGNSDAYCIAYTPRHVIAVWTGADGGMLPDGITGGTLPAEICAEVFKCPAMSSGAFVRPDTVVDVEIDAEELRTAHRVVRADADTPLRERICAPFSVYNMPGGRSFGDISLGDGDNFRIVDGF